MNKFKKVPLSLLLVSSVVLSNGTYLVQAQNNTPIVYSDEISDLTDNQLAALTNPVLQQYTADASHKIWKMTADTRFAVLATQENLENERLAEVVELVNSEFMAKEIISSSPQVMVYAQEKDAGYGDILITVDKENPITDQSTSSEAYKIVVDENGVHLTGASENAVLYGLRTIQNLMITNGGLVYGTIIDYPTMAERRVHVDCARKYISKDWFIRQIREMSYLKMNALQMHFSENLGFRIECETDPAIVSDQYLTKDEVREILKEAKKYGVKVIPSFDSPGHVDQILKAHPEYGQISSNGTHFKSGLDITNPEAIAYIRSLYSEYMDLFEGCTDFHIGGDEYMEFDRPPFTTQYKSVLNDYAKANIAPNATWKDTVANYINELAAFVHDHGFTPRIWNDGIYYGEGSYEGSQIIKMHDYIGIDFWSQMGWNRSIAKLNTFIEKGHDTIYNINASFFYYVLRNDMPTDGREQHSFDNLNADRKIFNEWTPGKFQDNTVADDSDFIKGAAMGIWCDNPNIATEDVITEDISDELRCLATKSWNTSSNSILTFEQFQENYTKLGNVAGFEKGSQLPDAGDFLLAEDLGKVTLRYISNTGKVLKHDTVKYGTVGDTYEFTGDDIYGYRLISTEPAAGKYTKDGVTYTFEYELYTDKSALETEVRNPLVASDYINETFSEYQTAYQMAKTVYLDETSEQLAVDQALEAITKAKAKVVKLEYYPLYVEVTYPLNADSFVAGYDQYKVAVDAGKNILTTEDLTVEMMQAAYFAIQEAKANLMRPDGNTPTISATDNYYSDWNVRPADKYSYEKMLDNDISTKCWFGKEQAAGKEFKFTFPNTINMTSVQIIQPSDVGADALVGADIQISTDETNWTTVGSFDETQLDYTATFEKTPVKYVRVLLTETKEGYWYQVSEVKFTYEQIAKDNTLRDIIVEAETLDVTNKTSASVGVMVDALIEAQKAYASESLDTVEVVANLREAIDNLKDIEEVEVDKTALQIAVDMAEAVTDEELENVIPVVVNEFKAALAQAKDVLANDKATQSEVDNAFTRLATAMHMLDFYKANKDELQDLVDQIKDMNKDDYTEDSWNVIQDAIDKAEEILKDENVMQEEVDKAKDALENALDNLVEKADKSLLEAFYNQVVNTDGSKYLESTFTKFTNALNNAKAVLDNEKATQVEVDATYNGLVKAFLDLRLIPNKDVLKDLIEEAKALNEPALANAIASAKAVYDNPEATQKEVDNATKALNEAINALAKPGDTKPAGSVKTGDTTNMMGTLGMISSLGMLALLRKKEENN